jgi:type II secretory pathway pseudopilin PulG
MLIQALPPMPPPTLPPVPSNLGFTETLTIWLTILGVMVALACLVVTGVGVFIGILAVFGYGTFREEVRTRAGQAAQTAASAYFKDAAFQDTLRGAIRDIQADSAIEPGPQEKVGEAYPGSENYLP